MPKTAEKRKQIIDGNGAYANGEEHLSDELSRLKLLIHRQVIKQQTRQSDNMWNQFKGLVLSDEEINGMLADIDNPILDENSLKSQDLENQVFLKAIGELESRIEKRRSASLEEGIYLPLVHMSQLFKLTPFEEQCLLICMAPELDRKYEKLFAYLQDDVTQKRPSVDLVLTLLSRTRQEKLAARQAFDQNAPLVKYRLLHLTDNSPEGPVPLLSRFLKIDDRIVNFLLDLGGVDAQLEPVIKLIYPMEADFNQEIADEEIKSRTRSFVRSHFGKKGLDRKKVVFYFYGPYGAGKRSLAKIICHDLALPLISADIREMLSTNLLSQETLWLLGREAILQVAALCLENFDYLLADNDQHLFQLKMLLKVVQTFSPLTFFLGSRPWKPQGLLKDQIFISLELPVPDEQTRNLFWEKQCAGLNQFAGDLDFGALAGKFRFTPGQIQDALASAQTLAYWRSSGNGQITMDDLYNACRAQSNPKLGTLARHITPKYTWSDIVLPSDQMNQLQEICNQAKYRLLVFGKWGFDRKLSLGKGLSVLFFGPPGTGKTMAAEIMANELQIDLYKIDLSQVVSKYIGETEKNLYQIFVEAQASSAILFFDEADALFGKRSEVKDAHDRYSNIEIGYLLQKMEEYTGISILATNLRKNMDEAFVRRMQAIVEFPFPDEKHREMIWKGMFPREAPLSQEIDYGFLSERIRLAGGNIKNIALSAAFFAARESSGIEMRQIMLAAKREYQKTGKPFLRVDFEPYYNLIEGK